MADLWQAGRILAGLFAAVVWTDPPGTVPVLTGGAIVSSDRSGNFLPPGPGGGFLFDGPPSLQPPFARVQRFPWTVKADAAGRYEEVRYRIFVTAGSGGITVVTTPGPLGDSHGVQAQQGLLRDPVQPQGKSTGKTVGEVIGRLIESLGPAGSSGGFFVDSVHGIQGYCERGDIEKPTDGSEILTGYFDVVVTNATVSRNYPAPPRVFAAALGGGVVGLSWYLPPLRYDFATIVLRRGTNPGDPAPTTPTGGTGITLSGPQAVTATDAGHSPGQVCNYAAFALFSEVNAQDRQSSGTPSGPVTVT